jgi:toxin ParE1/3/4
MTYTLRFLPEVEDDAINGYSWYEAKSPGLGEEFLRMFYACAGDIPRNPLLYPKVHNEFRRCLLRRFPYAVYFIINNEQIVVTGLFHGARDPRAVDSMLQNRKT